MRQESSNFNGHIYGYPAQAQQASQRFNLWGSSGQVAHNIRGVRPRDELMYTRIDATGGQSGSPVLQLVGDTISTAGVFVASCCGETTRYNVITRLGPLELALIENVTKQC